MSQLVFLPEARAEFDAAVDWYEERRAGLGTRFTLAVNAVLELLAKNPKMHAVVLEDARKAVVRGFPYCVYYREEDENVVVLSVFHTSRDPADWQSRI
jgi:plasmid stabilization system protein ParE